MAFVLTEEQHMLRDSARAFADEKLPVGQLRALRQKGGEEGYDARSGDDEEQDPECRVHGSPLPVRGRRTHRQPGE